MALERPLKVCYGRAMDCVVVIEEFSFHNESMHLVLANVQFHDLTSNHGFLSMKRVIVILQHLRRDDLSL